jgi:hypothetical protein
MRSNSPVKYAGAGLEGQYRPSYMSVMVRRGCSGLSCRNNSGSRPEIGACVGRGRLRQTWHHPGQAPLPAHFPEDDMPVLRIVIPCLLLVSGSLAAGAEAVPASVRACIGLADAGQRLACYDREVARLIAPADTFTQAPVAAAPGIPVAAAAPPASAAASGPAPPDRKGERGPSGGRYPRGDARQWQCLGTVGPRHQPAEPAAR